MKVGGQGGLLRQSASLVLCTVRWRIVASSHHEKDASITDESSICKDERKLAYLRQLIYCDGQRVW
jgi:hypothetical protein